MEELVIGTVEFIDAFIYVFDGMGLHDIHQHPDPHVVRLVHERFQLIRGTEAGGGSEKIGYVVAERTIVRVFHQSHELDRIVTQLLDSWQDIFLEFLVGSDGFLFLRHADMRFIDDRFFGLVALEISILPFVIS